MTATTVIIIIGFIVMFFSLIAYKKTTDDIINDDAKYIRQLERELHEKEMQINRLKYKNAELQYRLDHVQPVNIYTKQKSIPVIGEF